MVPSQDAAGAALQAARIVERQSAVLVDLVERRRAHAHELQELLDVGVVHELDVRVPLVHLVLVERQLRVHVHPDLLTSLTATSSPSEPRRPASTGRAA